VIVSAAEEHELILAVLGAHGALPETAMVQAHWLVEADLRGQGSHGMQRVPGTAVRVPGDRAERSRRQQAGVDIPDTVRHEALARRPGRPPTRRGLPDGNARPGAPKA
jgi:LDH2 family malate/lactate/ureidoglycolate dehydrogenase